MTNWARIRRHAEFRCDARWFSAGAPSEQVVERDRQMAESFAGRVEYGIRDGRRRARDAELADAVRTERHLWVGDIVVDDLDSRHVQVDRYMVCGKGGIGDPSRALIEQRLFHQGHADAHDDGAAELTHDGLGIHHPAAVERSQPTRDARFARFGIDAYLAELRPV